MYVPNFPRLNSNFDSYSRRINTESLFFDPNNIATFAKVCSFSYSLWPMRLVDRNDSVAVIYNGLLFYARERYEEFAFKSARIIIVSVKFPLSVLSFRETCTWTMECFIFSDGSVIWYCWDWTIWITKNIYFMTWTHLNTSTNFQYYSIVLSLWNTELIWFFPYNYFFSKVLFVWLPKLYWFYFANARLLYICGVPNVSFKKTQFFGYENTILHPNEY